MKSKSPGSPWVAPCGGGGVPVDNDKCIILHVLARSKLHNVTQISANECFCEATLQ